MDDRPPTTEVGLGKGVMTMITRFRRAAQLLCFVLLSLIFAAALTAACGGSDDEGSETTTDTTEATSTTETTSTTDSDTTSTSSTTPTTTSGSATAVEVFFNRDDPDECGAVKGYPRSAPTGADPIRFAFDELVKGPAAAETTAGAFSFFSSDTADAIRDITVNGDKLTVDFEDVQAVLGTTGAGTSCGSAALLAQLNATAFQFDAIDTVRYEMEGDCNEFGAMVQTDCIEATRADWEAAVATQLPGQPADGILPPGAILGVVGVEADDVLNVRALPGSRQNIVDTLVPLATGLEFTGRERLVGDPASVWYEIDTGSVTGWANSRYLAPLAGTVDATSEVVEVLGELPTGETVVQVGEQVIDARTRFLDGDQTVVIVDDPSTGDLNEITYDVLGFLDDSIRGERLHLFITPPEVADGPMTLKSVELTYICARGDGTGELCP
jgi:hypothetical protein